MTVFLLSLLSRYVSLVEGRVGKSGMMLDVSRVVGLWGGGEIFL